MNLLKKPNALFFLGIFFFCHLIFLWPGTLTPDSQGQYEAAVTGVYSDHHPFIMSFLWRYLDKIYPGPGLMLLTHLALLYGAVYFFMKSVAPSKEYRRAQWAFLLLPIVPHVCCYSGMIWKDVGCAYGFLWVGGVMTYVTLQHKNLSFFGMLGALVILGYGTLVKFQAQYLAPIFLLWISIHRAEYKKIDNLIKQSILVFGIFYGIIAGVNHFGPEVKENHAWQLVKLYDLAALSVYTDTPLFPEFTKTEKFSMGKLHTGFSHKRVDDLVFHDAILKAGETAEEREILWNTWARGVIHHPFDYMRHRAANLAYVLLSMPEFEHIPPILAKIAPPSTTLYGILYGNARIFGGIFLAHLLPLIFSVGYLFLGLFSLKKTRAAIPLVFLNSVGVGMAIVLFFFCMAGTPRYTYIMVCLFHASHVFAYRCWKNLCPSPSKIPMLSS